MECIAQNIANAIEKEINKRTELSSEAKKQLQVFADKMKLVAEENAKLMQSKQNAQTSTTRTQTAKKDKDDNKEYDAELDTKKDAVEMSPVGYVQSKIGDLVMPIEIVEELEEKVLSKEALDKIVEMIKCRGNK